MIQFKLYSMLDSKLNLKLKLEEQVNSKLIIIFKCKDIFFKYKSDSGKKNGNNSIGIIKAKTHDQNNCVFCLLFPENQPLSCHLMTG